MGTIYADTLFLINFIINYLLLLVTAKICSTPAKRWKMALSAAAGGIYGVLAVAMPESFWGTGSCKLLVGAGMALLVFWGAVRILRILCVFFAAAAAFGGAVFAVGLFLGDGDSMAAIRLEILLPAFGFFYGVFSLAFKRSLRTGGEGGIFDVTVELQGRSVRFSALSDTGNSLCDPVTGERVLVVDLAAVRELLPKGVYEILQTKKDAAESFEALMRRGEAIRFRLIPYKTIGTKSGLLLSFRADAVTIGKKEYKGMQVAISPEPVSDGGAYRALIST